MCLGIQGRLKGLSIVILYQGIMKNPSSLSLDELKKASSLKKTRNRSYVDTIRRVFQRSDLHMRFNNGKTLLLYFILP